MNLVDKVNAKYFNEELIKANPEFRTGDSIAVHFKIKEGAKTRIQIFKGICIAIKEENSINGHFRVRKVSGGIGVERVFPYHCPNIAKIEITSRGKSRRAKHYYLRDRKGKEARIAIDFSRK